MGDRIEKRKWQGRGGPPRYKNIPPGLCGIMATVEGNEHQAIRELHNLLDMFIEAEKLAGRIVTEKKEETADESSVTLDAADELSAACADLRAEKPKSQDYIKPKQMQTNVRNVLFFQMPCTVDELYELTERFIDRCQLGHCCRYMARCIPVELTLGTDVDAVDKAIGKLIEKHFVTKKWDKQPTYAVEFKARNNDQIKRADVLHMVDQYVKQLAPFSKVNLSNPDLSICVNVVNKATLLSCVAGYQSRRKYSTKPKGQSEDEKSVNTEDEERRKEEDVRFKDVNKFIEERKKALQERVKEQQDLERLQDEKSWRNDSNSFFDKSDFDQSVRQRSPEKFNIWLHKTLSDLRPNFQSRTTAGFASNDSASHNFQGQFNLSAAGQRSNRWERKENRPKADKKQCEKAIADAVRYAVRDMVDDAVELVDGKADKAALKHRQSRQKYLEQKKRTANERKNMSSGLHWKPFVMASSGDSQREGQVPYNNIGTYGTRHAEHPRFSRRDRRAYPDSDDRRQKNRDRSVGPQGFGGPYRILKRGDQCKDAIYHSDTDQLKRQLDQLRLQTGRVLSDADSGSDMNKDNVESKSPNVSSGDSLIEGLWIPPHLRGRTDLQFAPPKYKSEEAKVVVSPPIPKRAAELKTRFRTVSDEESEQEWIQRRVREGLLPKPVKAHRKLKEHSLADVVDNGDSACKEHSCQDPFVQLPSQPNPSGPESEHKSGSIFSRIRRFFGSDVPPKSKPSDPTCTTQTRTPQASADSGSRRETNV